MWLKDFLPREASCENVRILSYGYNTKLVGKGTVDDTFLDYRRNFIQQLENARNSEEVIILANEYWQQLTDANGPIRNLGE
jgi:hypothetical protein